MRKLGMAAVLSLAGLGTGASGADFDGDSRDDIAVFRPSTGLWSVRGVTRTYFGAPGDTPSPGDYDGDGLADFAVHRSSVNLWTAKGITRTYYGNSATDTPLTGGGGGQRIYDYVVKTGDGDDLEAAPASDVYRSVFIPAGNYAIDEIITVDYVTKIVGEDMFHTSLDFANDCYLDINTGCKVEGLRFYWGGTGGSRGNLYVRANYVTVGNCLSETSTGYGFQHAEGVYVSFIDCIASQSDSVGFKGCNSGFYSCSMVNACSVDGASVSDYGFQLCSYLSSCHAENCTVSSFHDNYFTDDATTKYSCN